MRHRNGSPHRRSEDPRQFHLVIMVAAAFAFALSYATTTKAAGLPATVDMVSDSTLGPALPAACALAVLASLWFSRNAKDFSVEQSISSRSTPRLKNIMFPETRALIVDHRLPNRQQLRQRLESLGVRVDEEGNGSRAADRALNERFDVIFMATHLPIMRVDAVTKILRRGGVKAPIVLTCASANEAEQEQTDPPTLTLTQPIDLACLQSTLTQLFPHKAVEAQALKVRQDVEAMQEAIELRDFEQLIALGQNLRELSESLGSSQLLGSIERLEAFIEDEQPEEFQFSQIKATLTELAAATHEIRDTTSTSKSAKAVEN